jgi:hypothetical protein
MRLMLDKDLETLSKARTGTDLETICWEAATEIKRLRGALDVANSTAARHEHIIKDCAVTNDTAALKRYAVLAKIYKPSK